MDNVIKKGQQSAYCSEGVLRTMHLTDIADEVRKYVNETKATSRKIILKAQEDAALMKEQAQKDGYRKGMDEGFAKGLEEGRDKGLQEGKRQTAVDLKDIRESLLSMLESLESTKKNLIEDSKKNILNLAVSIAEIITDRQIQIDSSVVLSNINKAIELTMARTDIILSVNPDDISKVNESLEDIKHKFSELKTVSVTPDRNIRRGGCRIRTKTGEVDNDIQTQLDKVKQLMTG